MHVRVWAAAGMAAKMQQIKPKFQDVAVEGAHLDCEVGKAVCGLACVLWVPSRTWMHGASVAQFLPHNSAAVHLMAA
eukprot:scaffold69448_cov14-Tisochrysis_lutea.AAC.1